MTRDICGIFEIEINKYCVNMKVCFYSFFGDFAHILLAKVFWKTSGNIFKK